MPIQFKLHSEPFAVFVPHNFRKRKHRKIIMARKIILSLGLILLLGGGFFWWRVTHPPLTDEQQIAVNLEDIRSALENGNTDRALNYMADGTTFRGMKKSEIRSQFTLGFTFGGAKDVRINFLNTRSEVKGAGASTKGHYKVDVRRRNAPESYDGDFSLKWEKRDGQWVITDGTAAGDIPN